MRNLQTALPFDGAALKFEGDWDPLDYMTDPLDDFTDEELSLYKTEPECGVRS